MSTTTVKVGNRTLSLSNLEKVLYPEAGFTKREVIEYYTRIAPVILPHLKGRALTLKRYPNGVAEAFFYEKRCPSHKPDWVSTFGIHSERKDDVVNYCVIDKLPSLVWVANLASLELHTLLSTSADVKRPTAMVFDLDPGPPAGTLECIPVALRLKELLEKAGLECFVKTSGGKGLHLAVPLNTAVTLDQTKAFSRSLAQLLERDDPERVTSNMKKSLRQGKIFIDWSQNDESKTTVCVYSLRARAQPTVSTPVMWGEVKGAMKKRETDNLVFRAEEVVRRVEKKGDLFEPVIKLKQRLPRMG